MSAVANPVAETNDVSLVERISKIEEALKDLKRVARQELKARRRRRANKVSANGERAPKGETPWAASPANRMRPWRNVSMRRQAKV